MAMIELIGLSKVYRNVTAVDRIDLQVAEGTVFGFLGPNGAGKTTTVKMMAGVLRPTAGKVVISGLDLRTHPSRVKRCVGFIPDRPFVYEKLSGVEFLNFIAGIYRLERGRALEQRLGELLALFELSEWQNELIESYSHGMKQRLVLCAALLHRPKVLIVDEPMVGLDPRGARLVKNLFRDLAFAGMTVFVSTHSLEMAEEICGAAAIIQGGSIIASGTPDNLRRRAGVDGNLEQVFLKLTERGDLDENPVVPAQATTAGR